MLPQVRPRLRSTAVHILPRAVRHRILSAVTVSVLLAVVTACSSIGTTSPTSSTIGATQLPGVADGGTLAVAVPVETRRWSPVDQWGTADLQVARAVYDRLMVRDENGRVVPELAEKVSSGSNHSVWTITLRPDVVFSDGTALDAAVVAANLEAQRNAAANGGLLDPVSSVTVVDRSTLTVTMFTPWSTFPEVLTTRVGTIAAPVTLAGFSAGPVGTGPFTYVRTEPDGTVVVTANRNYWRKGLPRLDEVRFVPIADAAERVDALLAGRVQMVAVDEPRQLSRLDALPNREATVVVHEDRNAERPKVNIALETGRPPFDRVTARRAVTLATDRAEILAKAFDGQGTIARGMISDTSPWFTDQTSGTRDLDRARRLVEEYTAETGLPLTFRLLVPPDTTLQRVASLWRVQLSQAGIEVAVEQIDASAVDLVGATGQFQALLQVGFSAAHPDVYFPLFRGIAAEQSLVSTNITRYINPLVTKAFIDARSTLDSARQVDDYRIVQEQVLVDVPYVFLVQIRQVVVTSPAVRDVMSWRSATGASGLGLDDATVSLAQVRIAR